MRRQGDYLGGSLSVEGGGPPYKTGSDKPVVLMSSPPPTSTFGFKIQARGSWGLGAWSQSCSSGCCC